MLHILIEANNPSTIIVKILNELKNIKFDKGNKDFQPTNLEVTKININNTADNVIPEQLRQHLILGLIINIHQILLKKNLIKFLKLIKNINQNLKSIIEFLVKLF